MGRLLDKVKELAVAAAQEMRWDAYEFKLAGSTFFVLFFCFIFTLFSFFSGFGDESLLCSSEQSALDHIHKELEMKRLGELARLAASALDFPTKP